MTEIPATWLESDILKKFTTVYKNSVKILTFSDMSEKTFDQEICVDGLLISTNKNDELVNIELMLPMSKWRRCEHIQLPKYKTRGRVFLPNIDQIPPENISSFETLYDKTCGTLQIILDSVHTVEKVVQFSNNAVASFSSDLLLSIYIFDKVLLQ